MKERPILFSAPMVRAILAGKKTQTRRIVTVPWKGSTRTLPYEPWWLEDCDTGRLVVCDEYGDYHDVEKTRVSPYGVPGDRLWVKETWAVSAQWDGIKPTDIPDTTPIRHIADDEMWPGRRRPAIFMRRWMSRLTLEITGVRVERLQEISEEDAKAEGVDPFPHDPEGDCWTDGKHLTAFQHLWGEINGHPGERSDGKDWASNPWVWVVEFRRVP